MRAITVLELGGSISEAAEAAGTTPQSLGRWLGCGLPVEVPGIAAKNVPLILTLLRRQRGVAADAPMSEGEMLYALKGAAREFIKAMDKFTAVLGVSREEVQ